MKKEPKKTKTSKSSKKQKEEVSKEKPIVSEETPEPTKNAEEIITNSTTKPTESVSQPSLSSSDVKINTTVKVKPVEVETTTTTATATESTATETEKVVTNKSKDVKKPKLTDKVMIFLKKLGDIILLSCKSPHDGWLELCKLLHPAKVGLQHLWLNCKVFGNDMKMGTKLAIRKIKGYELTRRESKRLAQAYADAFRMVPFSLFLVVPFLEFTLPFFLMFFPNMLPTSFRTQNQKLNREQRILQTRIKVAQILQDTMEHMAKNVIENDIKKKPTAEELLTMINKARNGELVDENEIVEISQLFKDDLTLDNMPRSQLVALCRYMGANAYGPDSILRIQLRNKIKAIKADDREIMFEGLDKLELQELQEACEERGMKWEGLEEASLRRLMEQWLDLSITRNVPVSLLILSRSFQITATPENINNNLLCAVSEMTDTVVNQVVAEESSSPSIEDVLKDKRRQNELIDNEREQAELFKEVGGGVLKTPESAPEVVFIIIILILFYR